ncbi:DMT family transporter [Herbaspirillum robiniae]|uniref:DMT family transporter n=1 Tax=Herbaspirillum robiniae TaxID=2014887 RepID=UPI003D787A62
MPLSYLFYSLLAVFIWSGNAIVTKLAAGNLPPGTIAFERWLIAFVILTPFVAKSVLQHRAVIRSHFWKLGVLGILGMAICQGVGYYAASFTTATNMALLLSLVPLVTFVLSTLYLKSLPPRLAILGVIISLAGILVVLGKGNPAQVFSQGLGRGDALMFMVVVALAGYGILLKTWSGPMPAFTSLYVQMGWALVFLIPGFIMEPAAEFSPSNVSMMLYAAIPGSIIAPYVWMKAVHHLGANRISIFMNLIPIITAVAAAAFLKEQLHFYHVVGGLLTIGGIVLSQRKPPLRNQKMKVATVE